MRFSGGISRPGGLELLVDRSMVAIPCSALAPTDIMQLAISQSKPDAAGLRFNVADGLARGTLLRGGMLESPCT